MMTQALSPQRERFAVAFCGEADGNATEAARIAGYAPSGAAVVGWKLKRNPRVQARIEALCDPTDIVPNSVDEVGVHERTITAVRDGCIAPLRLLVRQGSCSSFEATVYSTPIEIASLGWTCAVTQDGEGGWRVEIRGEALGAELAVEEAMPQLSMALLAACEAFVGRLRFTINAARHELATSPVAADPGEVRLPADVVVVL